MRIRSFEYRAAVDLADALQFLRQHGAETKLLAGGTDLVLAMKEKQVLPARVLSLHKVAELDFVSRQNGRLRLGALARHADLQAHAELRAAAPVLCEAAGSIGSWQIRNVATLGGNLCSASPAADSAPALLALEAQAVLVRAGAERVIPLSRFFKGPRETVLEPEEMLKEIVFARPGPRAHGCYLKLMRKKAVDLAVLGVAFQAEADEAGERLARVAIGLGGVAPTPLRAAEAENLLKGLTHQEALKALPEAAQAAVKAARPISDVRASAEYRRAMVQVYVSRAAKRVFQHLFSN